MDVVWHEGPREDKGREETNQANKCMKIGCVNVRGWGTEKLEDVCKELNEWKLDLVGVTNGW